MGNFKYKARTTHPQGKPKVYFCCHHADFGKYKACRTVSMLSATGRPRGYAWSFLFL